ncbi:TPA: hypothetical protein TXL60_001295 [Streptococcus suis]|uniref:hypothetical protein n=1 Tax=Streptococcus suis TaxID=1307 RepID=UPI00195F3465|nr:hypothetical protein [Streptococcus suis]MBM7154015.1 hypothetical protein [Streptococcus suis]MDG4503813.1 hypothetical protein [Streptococcus suis]HEL1633937.1 hypothetical protein [Streptococcus suis]
MTHYYSVASAKVHFSKLVLTTAQKDQLHRNYKKYAVEEFKKASKTTVFDGSGFWHPKKFKVYFHKWQTSDVLHSTALAKKLPPHYQYSDDDKKKIASKTATELRKAGYKVDVDDYGGLYLYKPAKKS